MGYAGTSGNDSLNDGRAIDNGLDINLCVLSFSALFVLALLFFPSACGGLEDTDFGSKYFTFSTLSIISVIAVADVIFVSLIMRRFSMFGLTFSVVLMLIMFWQYTARSRPHIEALFFGMFGSAAFCIIQTILDQKGEYENQGMKGKANSLLYGLITAGTVGIFLVVAAAAYNIMRML